MGISNGHQWGQWRYNKSALTLDYVDYEPGKIGNVAYQVDLETCGTAKEILDWIIQLNEKSWIRPHDIGDLVKALDELADGGLQDKFIGSSNRFHWRAHLNKP